jgi:hypothetical protein
MTFATAELDAELVRKLFHHEGAKEKITALHEVKEKDGQDTSRWSNAARRWTGGQRTTIREASCHLRDLRAFVVK